MKKEHSQAIIVIAVTIAVYFLFIRPVAIKFGLIADPRMKETEDRKNTQLMNEIKNTSQQQKPTKTEQQWQVIADQIYNDLRYSAISDNKDSAAYQVCRVQNDADFWILYKLFGQRREYLFGIPSGGLMNLSQFIKSNLSKAKIEAINKNYRSKNIKFEF